MAAEPAIMPPPIDVSASRAAIERRNLVGCGFLGAAATSASGRSTDERHFFIATASDAVGSDRVRLTLLMVTDALPVAVVVVDVVAIVTGLVIDAFTNVANAELVKLLN